MMDFTSNGWHQNQPRLIQYVQLEKNKRAADDKLSVAPLRN